MRVLVAIEKGRYTPDDMPLPDPPPLMHEGGADYVIRTWSNFKNHGVYPRAGGYDDQDDVLMRDWHTLNLYKDRVEAGIFSVMELPVSTFRASWADKAGE